ncbi:MAG TPA: hypothetical protein VF541_03350 [Longimicrobium sp.]
MIHVAFTAGNYDDASLDALWFAGSGVAVVLIGALTLLADASRTVRWTAVAANIAGLAMAVAFVVLTEFTEPQGVLLVCLFTISSAALAAASRYTRTSDKK